MKNNKEMFTKENHKEYHFGRYSNKNCEFCKNNKETAWNTHKEFKDIHNKDIIQEARKLTHWDKLTGIQKDDLIFFLQAYQQSTRDEIRDEIREKIEGKIKKDDWNPENKPTILQATIGGYNQALKEIINKLK